MRRATGIVRWFDIGEGRGSVTADGDGLDCGLIHSAIQGTTYGLTARGHRVAFDLAVGPEGTAACNVVRLQ